jgi:hypothetical protein
MITRYKSRYDTHGCLLVSGVPDDDVTSSPRIVGQSLIDATRENCRLDVKYVELIFIHFIVRMFGKRVTLFEYCLTDLVDLTSCHSSLNSDAVESKSGSYPHSSGLM